MMSIEALLSFFDEKQWNYIRYLQDQHGHSEPEAGQQEREAQKRLSLK